jgi:hypothetical protein
MLEDGSLVSLSYTVTWRPSHPGSVEQILDSSEIRGEPLTFPLGSKLVLPEIDHAARRLSVGGAPVQLSLHASALLGASRCCALSVPPAAPLSILLSLAAVAPARSLCAAGMTRAAAAAAASKEAGNRLHADGLYDEAAAEYRHGERLLAPFLPAAATAIAACGGGTSEAAAAAAAVRATALSLSLNLAACYLKLAAASTTAAPTGSESQETEDDDAGGGERGGGSSCRAAAAAAAARRAARRCSAALRLDGRSVKALFRRAQAARLLGDDAAAAADLRVSTRAAPAPRGPGKERGARVRACARALTLTRARA